MTIEMVTTKFKLWKDGKQFVLTTRKGMEVCRGTEQECKQFMEQHPYGVKARRS